MRINYPTLRNIGFILMIGPLATGIFTITSGTGLNSVPGYLTVVLGSISVTLIVVGFALKRTATDSPLTGDGTEIFYPEAKTQHETQRLITEKNMRSVQFLSAGLVSRREMILSCLRSKVPVQLAVQNPDKCVSPQERSITIRALYDIVTQVERDEFAKYNLKIRSYDDHASVRLTILKDENVISRYAILGWYVYSENNSMIQGSPYPSFLVSERAAKVLLRFADEEFNRKWDTGAPLDFEDIKKLFASTSSG